MFNSLYLATYKTCFQRAESVNENHLQVETALYSWQLPPSNPPSNPLQTLTAAKDGATNAPAPLLFRHEQRAQNTLCGVWKKELDSLEHLAVFLPLPRNICITCTEVKVLEEHVEEAVIHCNSGKESRRKCPSCYKLSLSYVVSEECSGERINLG